MPEFQGGQARDFPGRVPFDGARGGQAGQAGQAGLVGQGGGTAGMDGMDGMDGLVNPGAAWGSSRAARPIPSRPNPANPSSNTINPRMITMTIDSRSVTPQPRIVTINAGSGCPTSARSVWNDATHSHCIFIQYSNG